MKGLSQQIKTSLQREEGRQQLFNVLASLKSKDLAYMVGVLAYIMAGRGEFNINKNKKACDLFN